MRVTFVTALFVAGSLVPAMAQTPSPSPSASPSPASTASPGAASSAIPGDLALRRLDTMLRNGHADAAWFSTSFLAQIPIEKVNALLPLLKTNLGDYQSIEGAQGQYVGHFAKGTDTISVHLDADNKIDLLLFKPPRF